MNALQRLVSQPLGAFAVLTLAAAFEAYGDSFFQIGLYRSTGHARVFAILAGMIVLSAYGTLINAPQWDFGKLIGFYVVMFFLMGQVLDKVRFGKSPSLPIYAGGTLIVAGGLIIALWKD
jgi:hypothetical protein